MTTSIILAATLPVLGYHLDVSRCKVPTCETLERQVNLLEKLGYNHFELYTEHTFAYSQHETIWREASPMTPADVRRLDAYCRDRGIELVPNQNSFGHLDQFLKHPIYNDLAEMPLGGAKVPLWGGYVTKAPSALNPTDPRSLEFLAGLYDELFPCFESKYVNVGCDETHDLLDTSGQGRSAAEIAAKGPHVVYVEFLNKINALVRERGHTMMFWCDIIFDAPEHLKDIPADAICLDWGYEAGGPFEKRATILENAGRPFMLCPGTSSWGSLFGRTSNMMGNVKEAYLAAKKHGARGVLLTDWGDGGHPQPWIVSVPALVYLSALNQGRDPTRDELANEIDALLGCKVGESLLVYGDTYQYLRGRMDNTSEAMFLLREGKNYRARSGVNRQTMENALANIRRAQSLRDLGGAPEWVKDDCALLDLLAEALETRIREPGKKNFAALYEPRYRAIWLKYNRPGGLSSSLNQLFSQE